jgi:antitoxin (DNA-binding transcriptional repressor) of toxin-antitoxin stability system
MIRRSEAGEDLMIIRSGKPVASLVSVDRMRALAEAEARWKAHEATLNQVVAQQTEQ